LRAEGEATMWGKASDLSIGGCFVEMPIPLKPEKKLEITLWLSGTKLKLQAAVVSSAPGFGIGIKFLEISPKDKEVIQSFMKSIGPSI
jgi:hypothetical protein